jgi:hypothetical protein
VWREDSNSIVLYIAGICVTNPMGFGFDDRIYWIFIQLVAPVHISLSDALSSSSDWTLHWNYSDFQLNWTPLLLVLPLTPPYSFLCLLIIPRHGPPENTVFCCQECVFISPLPSNRCPIVESLTSGMCLPSRCLAMGISITVLILQLGMWEGYVTGSESVASVGPTCQCWPNCFERRNTSQIYRKQRK